VKDYKILWVYLSKKRKIQFILTIFLMLIASIAEMISIGAVIPFLALLTSPDEVFQSQTIAPLLRYFQINHASELLAPVTILFIIAIFVSSIVRVTLLYVMTRLSYATGADLSYQIYKKTLYQEYLVHIERNSSEIINSIITKTNTVIAHIITPVLRIISSFIIAIAIVSMLFFIDPIVAISASAGLGFFYVLIARLVDKKLKENGRCISEDSTKMIKALQEGLGGIRNVLLDESQSFFCKLYRSADLPLRRAYGSNFFINNSPRFLMEAVGMIIIVVLAYIMTIENDSAMVIPTLGALALGAQRLLPVLQQAYGSYSNIKGAKASFKDVLNLLSQNLPQYLSEPTVKVSSYEDCIHIKDLSFKYPSNDSWVLKDISINIKKGECIGLMGKTGSGKSTFVDIIMGLIPPTKGFLYVDNNIINGVKTREWQRLISHVPQNIYLSDATVQENIAFGVPKEKINLNKVEAVSKYAKISDVIENLASGYQTIIGEYGLKLSGGQRQRIGIARALYKDSDVLILDEATSALDNNTEREIMNTIKGLRKNTTIFIIAHRLSTLKDCNRILKFEKGEIVGEGTYQEMVKD
jgi:ATP-binding cassette, subfamily B, bacterial PglK